MTNTELEKCCHESRTDIPWLLNGTLSDSRAAEVREHMKECSDCQADLELHEQMRATVLGSELTPMVPATRAEDVIGLVGADRMQHTRGRRLPPWSIAIAASVAILGVAIVLSINPDRGAVKTNQTFETATSTASPGRIDYVLQLQFEESVSDLEKSEIVAQLEDVVKWSVDGSGDYEVHVQLAESSLAVLQDYEEHAVTLEGVQSAKFTALQLPMR